VCVRVSEGVSAAVGRARQPVHRINTPRGQHGPTHVCMPRTSHTPMICGSFACMRRVWMRGDVAWMDVVRVQTRGARESGHWNVYFKSHLPPSPIPNAPVPPYASVTALPKMPACNTMPLI